MDDVVEVFGKDVDEDGVHGIRDNVDDEVDEDDGYVEVELEVINSSDVNVVLDVVVVVDDVHVVVVANLRDEEVVEVNEVVFLAMLLQ